MPGLGTSDRGAGPSAQDCDPGTCSHTCVAVGPSITSADWIEYEGTDSGPRLADSLAEAAGCEEAVFSPGTVHITGALSLAQTGPLAENVHACCGCLTGVAVGVPIASADRSELAGADFRPRLACSRGVTALL